MNLLNLMNITALRGLKTIFYLSKFQSKEMDRIMIQRIYNDHILNKKSNNEYKNVIVNGGNTVGLYAAFLLFIGNLLLMVVKFRVAPRPRSPTPLSNDFFRILSAPKEFENPVLRLRGRRRTLITLDDQTSPLTIYINRLLIS